MLSYAKEMVAAIERDPGIATRAQAVVALRALGLDDFGALLLRLPDPEFPRLSALLPAMASTDVQESWTGASGYTLLRQTCAFVRTLAHQYAAITGRTLEQRRVLDFGCGYGRIARLMPYFSDPALVWGVDPWDRSIELCREAGLGEQFVQSDYLPRSLPVSGPFDVTYAFSVFTHLSRRACLLALQTLRDYISDDGVLAITIRPVEIWPHLLHVKPDLPVEALQHLHRDEGFAFHPHNRPATEGDITYGDTSMTIAWLRANAHGWKVRSIDRSLEDSLQVYVFLTPNLDS